MSVETIGYEIGKAYESGELSGWLGKDRPDLVREQFDLIAGELPKFQITGQDFAAPRKAMLYQACRSVLGKDTLNYPQQAGSCVAEAAKNAAEYLQCVDMAHRGAHIQFRPVFAPYYYGTSRNYVGRNAIGAGDGSLGSWMASAAQKYGTLFADEAGLPKYNGNASIARAWGDSNARPDLDKWVETGSQFLVKTVAKINSWKEFVAAICNGWYPVHTCSDLGYNYEASSDGFHRQTTSWAHAMTFIGVDDNDRDPYAILLNTWGDVHGRLKDFDDGHDLPVGVLRIRRRDVERHINAGETYAYSNLTGFPARELDKALFKLM